MSEPRIFIEVVQELNSSQHARVRYEISLTEWQKARYPGGVAEWTINTALAEVSSAMSKQKFVEPQPLAETERLRRRLKIADAACANYYEWEYGTKPGAEPNPSLLLAWKKGVDD